MAVNDGHMTDHTSAFGLPHEGIRIKFAAMGDPKGSPDRNLGLGGVTPLPTLPTLGSAFGKPKPPKSPKKA